MKHSRITLAVSTLALGVTLGLQPLSVSFTAQMFDTVGAIAKGGDGNGGGGQGGGGQGGGGHGGGGGTGGGGHGSAGDARGGGHGPDKSKSDSSVAERGSRDGARSGSARGHAGGESNRGNREPKGLLEGFLTDVRSATGLGRSGRDAPKSTGAKSTKSREGKTTVTTSTTPAPATEKTSIGRLNAAHAVANGNTNAARNSAVGQIAIYAEALRDYSTARTAANEATMKDAAAALDRAANKPLTRESIEALNEILGLGDVAAEDVMTAVETSRKEDADETSTTSSDASVEE
jgi:hypothetical protein